MPSTYRCTVFSAFSMLFLCAHCALLVHSKISFNVSIPKYCDKLLLCEDLITKEQLMQKPDAVGIGGNMMLDRLAGANIVLYPIPSADQRFPAMKRMLSEYCSKLRYII